RRGAGVRGAVVERSVVAQDGLLRAGSGAALAAGVPQPAAWRAAARVGGDGVGRRAGHAAVASHVHRREPGGFAEPGGYDPAGAGGVVPFFAFPLFPFPQPAAPARARWQPLLALRAGELSLPFEHVFNRVLQVLLVVDPFRAAVLRPPAPAACVTG